ncbi:hypothetical protein OIU74_003484 [Salix koriyanagi]|uniref:Uncharacterized protein n=1 Tax=Salix koriyanagi TaxID=2511006 RepID=A0A9Q0UZL0_9ROSI|nr:hypothetical protein OIU74_003484 [Salix koriyanagi]
MHREFSHFSCAKDKPFSLGQFAGSNDYVNNYLQPFLADGQEYTPEEFVKLVITTLDNQLTVKKAPSTRCCISLVLSTIFLTINHISWIVPMAEVIPAGCPKGGLPWSWSTWLHSITEGEIKDREVLKESKRMGVGIQLRS